ncbi:M15 family metallopeptidase [Aerococcaceae bacterium NML201209]|nr:M15 family metallopeptidase [Aerococcaceae bacterium NML201209]
MVIKAKLARLVVSGLAGSLIVAPVVQAEQKQSSTTVSVVKADETLQRLVKLLPTSARKDDPNLFLINKENPLVEEPIIDLVYDEYGQSYSAVIVEPLNKLLAAGSEAGFYYQVVSGYRSMAEQAANRQYRIDSYIAEGYSESDANYMTDLFYAPANASEHTSGLAVDLLGTEWAEGLHVDYAYQPSAQWLADNAHLYGFHLRYMEGKSDITGYHYEPWHFRYVGKEHAVFMKEHDLTLEEYLELIDIRDQQNN